MTSLRMTSLPERSMRGSGSEKPCSRAMRTVSLNGMSADRVLKMKLSVPLRTASSLRMRSPELHRSLIVLMIGRPAPTLVSKSHLTPRLRARSLRRR